MEGSTRLLTTLGDRFAELLDEHQRLIRAALRASRGIEVSTEGDSFFAVFRSAADAVEAAARIQRDLADHPWPASGVFRVRIGLNTGQAVLAGDDYVGIDVNRAARIANAANGGQVLLSDATHRSIARLPAGVTIVDVGRHRLRDIGAVRLWEVAIEGLATSRRPLRTLEAHPSNLPHDVTSLVDRHDELVALAGLIRDHSVVTVSGPGGIGKSRVAIQAARDLLGEFPDGVFHLDLAPIDRIASAVEALADLLGLRVGPTDDPTDVLLDHLRDRHALLVLETADRLPGVASLVARMAATCPALRSLVTARSPLRVRAEQTLVVGPLGLPVGGGAPEASSASPAVELFVARARAIDPTFELDAANAPAVDAIVRRLDGLPLAIELAAASVRLLSVEAILARLERRLPLLSGGVVDLPERQRTMRDTIDWSFQLLEPVERRLLQGLSVFAGGFDLEAIEAVAGDDTDRDTGDALETLAALVDRSLVERVQLAESRFRLLGTIREFAAERLESSGDAATTRDRHARYWLAVATRESEVLDGPRASTAMARLDEAADEFRSALHWTLAKSSVGDPDHLALRLVSALGRFWYLHGRVHEAASWLESALEGDPEAPAELRASVLHWSGVMLDESRMTDRAIGHFEQALELERRIGDDRTIARELNSLGVVYRNAGDLARAEPLLAESLAMRRRLGDGQGVATVLTNLGIVALDRDRVEDARQLLDEAVAVDRSLGNTSGLAYSSSALGTALLRSGRRGEALALIRSALGTFADLGDADGVAGCLEGLGEAGQRSDPGSAARLLLAAGAIRGRAGLWPHPVDRGRTEALVGSVEAALSTDELSAAAAEATAMDVPASVAFALAVLGRWAMEGSSAAQPGSVAAASPSPDGSGVVDRAPRGRDRCSP